ncbi:MAG TPA: DegV family protein [Thermomicrobiales bacterium]|nr:DegV family protein [Thermomicrobiales bacterium]
MPERPSVAVITDSTCDLSPEITAARNITVVPLNIHIGDETFRDQVDITTDEFMRRMDNIDALPTTSQPSVGTFEEAFLRLAANHREAVCITISSRLSGTYQSAQIAASNVSDKINVSVVDSLNASYGLGFQVLRAAELAAEGKDAATIASILLAELHRYHVIVFVETLEHLRRGGRIGKAAQMVGSLLQLRPLLRMDEGQVVPFERTRTRGKAINAIVDFATSIGNAEEIAVLYNTTPDDARDLAHRLAVLTPERDIQVIQLGPVIDTHIGPDVLGVVIKARFND